MKLETYKPEFYNQTLSIYLNSFPENERYMSFDRLITLNNTELMCLVEQDTILGFIYSIILDDMIFILYLSVNGNYRSKGCGSYILNSYLEKYKEK